MPKIKFAKKIVKQFQPTKNRSTHQRYTKCTPPQNQLHSTYWIMINCRLCPVRIVTQYLSTYPDRMPLFVPPYSIWANLTCLCVYPDIGNIFVSCNTILYYESRMGSNHMHPRSRVRKEPACGLYGQGRQVRHWPIRSTGRWDTEGCTHVPVWSIKRFRVTYIF